VQLATKLILYFERVRILEQTILVRRSSLIMPSIRSEFVEKAWQRNADAICLDLEDSVLEHQKEKARSVIRQQLPTAGKGGSDVLVRINSHRPMAAEDLDASVYPGLSGIILPKVEDPEAVAWTEEEIGRLEKLRGLNPGSIDMTLLIESCLGYTRATEILSYTRRAKTLMLGAEDFLLDLGITQSSIATLLPARTHLMITARAFGLESRGLLSSIADFSSPQHSFEAARNAYQFGYRGATCVHPGQVAPYNQAFAPSEEEIKMAKAVLETYEQSKRNGKGSVALNGKMIDGPIALRAQQLVSFSRAVEEMELRKSRARNTVISSEAGI